MNFTSLDTILWLLLKIQTNLPEQHFPGVSGGLQKWSENGRDSQNPPHAKHEDGFFIKKDVLKKFCYVDLPGKLGDFFLFSKNPAKEP